MVAVAVRAVSVDISLYLEKIGNTLIIVRNELYLSACSTFKLIRGKFGRVFGGLLAELLYKVELFFCQCHSHYFLSYIGHGAARPVYRDVL